MAAELLDFASTYYKQPSGTDGIQDWMEINASPAIEVYRVTSNESGDWIIPRKIRKISAALIQNHGATFATGVARDEPKLTIADNKVTITHTGTRETFSVIIMGDR